MPIPNRISGCRGRLVLGASGADLGVTGDIVVDVTNFSISESSEIPTFRVLNDCNDQTGDAASSYTATIEGIYAATDAGQTFISNGTLVAWRFYPSHGDDATVYEEGEFRFSSVDRNRTPDENQSFTASATGDGAITRTAGMW